MVGRCHHQELWFQRTSSGQISSCLDGRILPSLSYQVTWVVTSCTAYLQPYVTVNSIPIESNLLLFMWCQWLTKVRSSLKEESSNYKIIVGICKQEILSHSRCPMMLKSKYFVFLRLIKRATRALIVTQLNSGILIQWNINHSTRGAHSPLLFILSENMSVRRIWGTVNDISS
jgi:hypothetical protein